MRLQQAQQVQAAVFAEISMLPLKTSASKPDCVCFVQSQMRAAALRLQSLYHLKSCGQEGLRLLEHAGDSVIKRYPAAH